LRLFALDVLPLTLVLIFLLIVSVLIIWLVIISQIALYRNMAQVDSKQIKRPTGPTRSSAFGWLIDTFKNYFNYYWNEIKESQKYFWHVLGAYVFGYWIIILFFVLLELTLGVKYLYSGSTTWGIIFAIVSFVIVIALALVISIVIRYALMYIILKNRRFVDAVKDGLVLFGENWLISLEILVVLGVAILVAVITYTIMPILLSTPFYLASTLWPGTTLQVIFAYFALFINTFTLLVIKFLSLVLLSTFFSAVWTTLFMEINKPHEHKSALVRFIYHLPKLGKK
jgi:hypothetical protein